MDFAHNFRLEVRRGSERVRVVPKIVLIARGRAQAQIKDWLDESEYELEIFGAGMPPDFDPLNAPDLILYEVNGLATAFSQWLVNLRNKTQTALTPVIAFNWEADAEADKKQARQIWRAAMNAGADDFLLYPFSRDELTGAIVTRLGKRLALGQHVLQVYENAQAELAQTERRFHAFMDNSPLCAWINDEDARLVYVNHAYQKIQPFAWGFELGKTLEELFPPELAATYYASHREILDTGQPKETLQPYYFRDGTLGQGIFVRFPLTDTQGNRMVGGVGLDITKLMEAQEALRRSQEQLQQAQKMESIGRLAGGIAHDFNNLLTVIIGNVDLLKVIAPLEVQQVVATELESIQEAALRAAEMTRQLLAFSRKQVLQPRTVNLNDSVNNIEKMLNRIIGENIALTTTVEPSLKPIQADPVQIEQVLMNLVLNARDAMPQGGQLLIETANCQLSESEAQRLGLKKPGDYVCLKVQDDGTGIDPEDLPFIFEPFFTTKIQGKGTGLGLATVYGIVQQSGGVIEVQSQPGQGARFKVYFPATNNPGSSLPKSLSLDNEEQSGGVVLVAEDDSAVRELTRQILRSAGFTVLTGGDGQEALEIAQNWHGRLDLLLTDVVMPRMGGNELASELLRRNPGLPVVFMSGYSDNLFAGNTELDSKAAFLEKPFHADKLLYKVRHALSTKG
jgi:two-component system, cell cycle sensor histidine kinase and response regulator CckA